MWLLSNNLGRVCLNAKIFGPPPPGFPRHHPTPPSPCGILRTVVAPTSYAVLDYSVAHQGCLGPASVFPTGPFNQCLVGQWRVLCIKCFQEHKSNHQKERFPWRLALTVPTPTHFSETLCGRDWPQIPPVSAPKAGINLGEVVGGGVLLTIHPLPTEP